QHQQRRRRRLRPRRDRPAGGHRAVRRGEQHGEAVRHGAARGRRPGLPQHLLHGAVLAGHFAGGVPQVPRGRAGTVVAAFPAQRRGREGRRREVLPEVGAGRWAILHRSADGAPAGRWALAYAFAIVIISLSNKSLGEMTAPTKI
uniref:Uncharacterized protein n=1 Tax=Oryza brachyantha TaxID=4533 RepID=J3LWR9_ORYBR